VPREDDASAALPLDLQLILAGEALMRFARGGIGAGCGKAALHLLAKEEIVDVHRGVSWGLEARSDTAVQRELPMSEQHFIRRSVGGHPSLSGVAFRACPARPGTP
jgi:hypothetical protein